MVIIYYDICWTNGDQCWYSDNILPENIYYIANHISTNVYSTRIRKKWD